MPNQYESVLPPLVLGQGGELAAANFLNFLNFWGADVSEKMSLEYV